MGSVSSVLAYMLGRGTYIGAEPMKAEELENVKHDCCVFVTAL